MLRIWMVFTVLSVFAAANVAAGQDDTAAESSVGPQAEFEVSVLSDYIDRGQNVYDGLSVQPWVALGYGLGEWGVVGVNYWGQLAADGDREGTQFTETDLTLRYDAQIGMFDFGLGNTWIEYSDEEGTIADSKEWFAAVLIDTVLQPMFAIVGDYDAYDNLYYEVRLSHDFAVGAAGFAATLTPEVTVGFSTNSQKVYARDGLEYTTVGVSADLPLGDEVTLSPTVNYTVKSDPTTSDELWFGVTIAYTPSEAG